MDPSDEFVLIDNINGTVYTMEQNPMKGLKSVEIELYKIPYGEEKNVYHIAEMMTIWAATQQNQQSDCVPSKDSDQPGHLRCEFSRCAQWVAKDPRFLHADSEDSDQTGRMPRLIRVFTGRTATLLVLSCRGSYYGLSK